MFVSEFIAYVVLSYVGIGLCDELIPHLKEQCSTSNKVQKPKKDVRNVDRLSNPENMYVHI
jgi:hypothetical protein